MADKNDERCQTMSDKGAVDAERYLRITVRFIKGQDDDLIAFVQEQPQRQAVPEVRVIQDAEIIKSCLNWRVPMSDSWPNDWKNRSLTLDEARGELLRIATQVRGALAGLGLCYQARNGYVYEVQFSRLDILPDGADPLLGLITVNTQPGALPPRISIDRLCSDQVLKHLSSVVHWPVFRWNSTGLTYAVLFRPLPEPARLPANAPLDLDERPRGRYKLGLGLSQRGPEWYGLEKMNHVMVAGETDAGKSTFLRSLVYQVLHWERPVTLYLSDRVGATFAPVAGVPQLGAPIARTVEEVLDIGKRLSDEMARRDQLFLDAPDYPEKLSEYYQVADATLPLVLWIIDKAPAFLNMSGGRNGVLARIWSDIAPQSRKYGIYLVLASHDWRADALPPTLKSALAFRPVPLPSMFEFLSSSLSVDARTEPALAGRFSLTI